MVPRFARLLLLGATLVGSLACAQTAGPVAQGLSFDEILMRLQIRRWEYARSVPDFFADEYVTSEMTGMRMPSIHAVTESIFRLKRTSPPDVYPPELTETRTLRRSNGVTSMPGSPIAGPTVIVNAFSTGLNTITLGQKACYVFTISRHREVHGTPVFAVDYRLKPGAENIGYCVPWRDVSGQAIVQEGTFNVLQFKMHVPRYPIAPGMVGPWHWSISYAPVLFDGRTFYMPKRIDSISESIDGRYFWNFTATYRNYHKTGVHSRIITDIDAAAPQ